MTLTIHTQEDEQRQLSLTVEVAEERVEKAMQQTARKLAREMQFPGFRKGKVPYQVIIRRVGADALRAETIDEIAQTIFEEALEQIDTFPYAQPALNDIQLSPLVLKFTVPLAPKVTLGDYRVIRKEIEPVEVKEEAVDEALERVRNRQQKLEVVERPAELGDMVRLSGEGKLVKAVEVVEETAESTLQDPPAEESHEDHEHEEHADDQQLFHEHGRNFVLDSFKLFPGTTFVENVVGMAANETKTFTLTFPEDYQEAEYANKEATFTITVEEVQMREVPELNDELAQKEGDYQTLEDLRNALREDLKKAAEDEAKDQRLESLVDDLLAAAQIVYPPAAVKAEVDEMIEEFKGQVTRAGWEWQDFLRLQSKEEADMQKDFQESAVKRLQRRLVLQQFIADEKLKIEENELDAAIDSRISRFGDENLQTSMRGYYRTNEFARNTIVTEVLMEKVHERVEAILTGNAPDLSADEPETAEIEQPALETTEPAVEVETSATETTETVAEPETAENGAE